MSMYICVYIYMHVYIWIIVKNIVFPNSSSFPSKASVWFYGAAAVDFGKQVLWIRTAETLNPNPQKISEPLQIHPILDMHRRLLWSFMSLSRRNHRTCRASKLFSGGSFINKLWKSEPAASCRAWLPFGTRSACKGRAGVSKTGTSRHKLKFLASIKDPALFNTSTTSRFCAWTLTRTRSTIPCSSQGCMVIWLIWFQPVWLFNYNIERDLESTSTRIRAVQCSPALGCTL